LARIVGVRETYLWYRATPLGKRSQIQAKRSERAILLGIVEFEHLSTARAGTQDSGVDFRARVEDSHRFVTGVRVVRGGANPGEVDRHGRTAAVPERERHEGAVRGDDPVARQRDANVQTADRTHGGGGPLWLVRALRG
jgi:hypothetical protein